MTTPVQLHVYDLSNGLAAQLSQQLTGRYFRAVFHTGIVVFGREYFFGGGGIESSLPGRSPYGTPIEQLDLGATEVTPELWREFLAECGESYGVGKYHLLEHNCNTFSNAASNFLLGRDIPPEITALPEDFLRTPLGMMLRPQIDGMYRPSTAAALREETPAAVPQHVVNGKDNPAATRSELVTFKNTPTIAKLCAKLAEQAPDVDSALIGRVLDRLVKPTASASTQTTAGERQRANDQLAQYLDVVPAVECFAGLDVLRILLLDRASAQAVSDVVLQRATTLSQLDAGPVGRKTLMVLMRALANGCTTIPRRMHASLAPTDSYAAVAAACAHEDLEVSKSAVAAAHNLVLTHDQLEQVDEFALGLATSLADKLDRDQSKDGASAWPEETRGLVANIVQELSRRGSDDCKEIVSALSL